MRTVLITGSTRNLGLAMARWFASRGHAVVINGRSPEAVDSAARSIRAEGGIAIAGAADVTRLEQVQHLLRFLEAERGSVDVLVNNAVSRVHGDITVIDPASWREAVEVVLTGAFNCIRSVLPGMRARGWGRIVNIAGVSGQTGAPNRAPIVAAKSGLIGLTKAVAHEAAAHGITANAISPGLLDTQRDAFAGDPAAAARHYERVARDIPLGRLGTTAEVAALCGFLCSDDAGYITGQVLAPNGGLYM